MTKLSRALRRARLVLGIVIAGVMMATAWSSLAHAHTDFESSEPADRDVVEGPLDEVAVSFTNPAVPAGEGFQLLDPSGEVRAPSSVDPTDGTTFVLRFEPPLTAGTYGVRWMVRAGDAHPIDGSFRFEVTEPPAPSTTVAPATTSSPGPVGSVPAAGAPATPTTAPDAVPATTVAAASADSSGVALDDFLAADSGSGDAVAVGRIGRTLTFLGTVFGLGTLAALVWVIRGRPDEIRTQLTWIRLAGLVIAAGGLTELAALEATPATDLTQILDTKAGVATLLKIIGGVAVFVGFHTRAGRMVAPARSLSAAVATDLAADDAPAEGREPDDDCRWSPSGSAVIGLAGFALVLGSFWFDGHTVSRGPWAVHALVNLVHVGAASVWAGGVFAMTTVAWRRHRRGQRVDAAGMVIRFSSVATVSLVAVVLAGLVMTVLVLDAPGDLFATEWGRLLLVKLLAVAVASGLGAYNHFKLRPALERTPHDPALARHLRVSLTIESAVLAGVVVLTALLVAAAT